VFDEGELSSLSGNSVSACSKSDWSRPHIRLPPATAVCYPEINLILRIKSQPLEAPARTHPLCNLQRRSARSKIEKSACDQSNCSKSNPPNLFSGACGHIRVAEPERASLCRIETQQRRHAMPILAARKGCHSSTLSLWLPLCSGCQGRSDLLDGPFER
jgi:hypothetical protein